MDTGVYIIKNKVTGKRYIGSTRGIRGFRNRFYQHKLYLRNGTHHSRMMQVDCFIHGVDSFEFTILVRCPVECCHKLETWFLQTVKPEYNKWYHATGLGKITTDSAKAKQSVAKIGKPSPKKGCTISQSQKDHLSMIQKNKKQPQTVIDAASKIVIDMNTGVFYDSIKEVADLYGINRETLGQRINGRMKTNNTPQFKIA